MYNKKTFIVFFYCCIILLFNIGINIEPSFSESGELSAFETAKGHFKKGFVYFNNMQYLSAVEFFRKAVSVYPEYYTAREYLARSYKLAGFVNEAVKEWENLAEMTSKNVSIMNKLDALKFKESSGLQKQLSAGSGEFIFSGEYNSSNLGRFRFSKPIDLAIDNQRNIYVTSFSTGKLVKLDSNGEGLSIFDHGAGTRFYGVDCSRNNVCVADFKNDVVHVLDKSLNAIRSFGAPGSDNGEFHGPAGIVFDGDENIYVVDSGNHRVQKFEINGRFILKFGSQGEYEGQLDNPSYILINEETVYVSDTGNHRIACFDKSGNFIRNISIEGLENPRGINIYKNELIISDDRNGLVFYSLSDNDSYWFKSWDNGSRNFSMLTSACADRDGMIYCLDHNFESLFVFSPLSSMYTNLYLEITSIDTDKYPVIAFYLNVRNRNGSPVYNLKRKNFRLVEDNAVMNGIYIDYLKNNSDSVSIVLCVDRSNYSMGYHNEIPWISDFILKKMKRNDSIQLLNYNKDSWVGNDFDWSRRRTIRELRKRNYSSGKAIDKVLYNAISNLLMKLNRRGVVLISDGRVNDDSFSIYTPENIIEYAKSHYIPVYIIVFKEINPVLKRIAEETGGSIFKANELDGLRSIYNKIKESEEYRYIVVYSTYKSPSIKGWWSDVRIEVNDKGQRGVEWGGYFVP